MKTGKLYEVQGQTAKREGVKSFAQVSLLGDFQVDRSTRLATGELDEWLSKQNPAYGRDSPFSIFEETMKRFLSVAGIGGFVGMGISSWAAVPGLIWYGRPADPGALCNCATTVKWTAVTFLQWQGVGFALGSALAVFLRYYVFKKKKTTATEQMLDL